MSQSADVKLDRSIAVVLFEFLSVARERERFRASGSVGHEVAPDLPIEDDEVR